MILDVNIVKENIGKKIRWSVEGYAGQNYDSRKFCEKAFPKAKVLSYQKEAFGLNLQEYTNTIYFDKTFDWAMREQASRRTFRVGQEYDCRYYDLTGNAGLDKIIDKNIDKKIGMVEYFKGKTKEQIKQEL